MTNHCLLVFTGESSFQGFLRWCRISSIHSMDTELLLRPPSLTDFPERHIGLRQPPGQWCLFGLPCVSHQAGEFLFTSRSRPKGKRPRETNKATRNHATKIFASVDGLLHVAILRLLLLRQQHVPLSSLLDFFGGWAP